MNVEPQLPRAARVFVSFVTLLRANSFAVAPEQTTAFLTAIELLGPRDLRDIRQAALATLAPPRVDMDEHRTTREQLFERAALVRRARVFIVHESTDRLDILDSP